MKTLILALVLGIFLNMSSAGGTAWPVGSVTAIVMVGFLLKTNQDKHFEAIMQRLESIESRLSSPPPIQRED